MENRKKKRANSFVDNATQDDSEGIFNYLYYLNYLGVKDDSYCNHKKFKDIVINIHSKNNSIIRLDDDSYIKQYSYQNIKLSPDGFDEDGNLVDIYPFSHKYNKVNINNISRHYYDYIQILLKLH